MENGERWAGGMSFGSAGIAFDLRRLLRSSESNASSSRSSVLDSAAELQTYAYDASFLTQLEPRAPDVVVIARSTYDLQMVMRYAFERGIPVTPRGAASGHAGRQVRPDQRLGARAGGGPAGRASDRDRLGRLAGQAVVGRARANQAVRG